MNHDPKSSDGDFDLSAAMRAALADAEALARRDEGEPEPAAEGDEAGDLDLFAGMDDGDETGDAFAPAPGNPASAEPPSAASGDSGGILAEAARRVRRIAPGGEVDLLRSQVEHLRERLSGEQERAARFERQLEIVRNDLKATRKRFARVAEREDELNGCISRLELELPRKTTEAVLTALLPALDSTDAVLSNLLADERLHDEARSAVELLRREWDRALEAMQIKAFDALGQPFDPAVHAAISEVETAEVPAGTCVRQVGRGYLHELRLLRSAQVVVSRAPEE